MSFGAELPTPPHTPGLHDPPKARTPPPNILLVIADDHRADAIGALGHPVVITPHLDGLVHRGTTLTRVNTAGGLMAAVCSPSRASLLTGLFPFRADAAPRLIRNPPYEVRIPSLARTLPQHFRSAGYETFVTGKWHNDLPALLRSFEGGRRIFHGGMCDHEQVPVRDLDEIRRGAPERIGPGFSTDLFCGAAEEFLRGRTRDRPFFAWVALTSPHDPRTPPAEYRKLYDAASLPLPANFQTEHAFDNGELAIRDECLIERPLSPDQVRGHLADYYGMISHHDAAIGRVLNALKETGQDANTLVVYLSDHGLALGCHGLLGKQNVYEHSVRVPLILTGPGVPSGVSHDGLGYAFDLYATLCDLAGVPAPRDLDSRSLVPGWSPGAAAVRTTLGAAYMAGQRMITDGRWKLVVYRVGKTERIQLFDLRQDPHECHNLAAEPGQAERIEHLRRQLHAWQAEAGDRWLRETQPASDLSGLTA